MTNVILTGKQVKALREAGYEVHIKLMQDDGRLLCSTSSYAVEHLAATTPSKAVAMSNDYRVSGAMLDTSAKRLGLKR